MLESDSNYYNNTDQREEGEHALNLNFTIGYSSNMIGAVHNLTFEHKKEIFFPSAHTGVIYNYETSEQKLLQGHCNTITACCVAYDEFHIERLIITADSGKNAMLVIWDAETAIPKRTIFKIPEDQIVSIDISKDCTFIAMLSWQIESGVVKSQKITIWEWRNKAEQIFMCDFEDDEDEEIYELIRFNPNCEDGEIEILTNGKAKILFWNITPSNPESIRPYFPLKSKGEAKKGEANTKNIVNSKHKAISYTQSTFLLKSTMAITATTAGYVIVWDICEALCKENEVKTDRRKIKTVQLIKYKKDQVSDKDIINYLYNYDENIVVGSGDGAIRFYDYNFIIVRWFENVCWLVTSISFDMQAPKDLKNNNFMGSNMNDKDSNSIQDEKKESGNTNKFTCKPFITADISATITRVCNKKESLINYNDDNVKYEEIYRGIESNITSIALHPKQQILIIGTDSKSIFKKKKDSKQKESIIREKKFEFKPYIQLFYYPDHMKIIKEESKSREEEIIKQKKMDNENKSSNGNNNNNNMSDLQIKLEDDKQINAYKRYLESTPNVIEYSPDGDFLMVGTDDEKIYVLHPENLSLNLGSILQIKDITEQGAKAPIHEIIFSPDEKHFAASDTIGRIGLFKNENPYSNNNSDKKEWTLVARHHFKENPVISFAFCMSEKDKFNRLYAICKDKHLYEFEILANSNYDNYTLQVKSKIMMEHDCLPTSLVCFQSFGSGKDNLIISNDDFKLRTVMLSESSDPVIKLTCLGPCYGTPIKKLRVIPSNDRDRRVMAFNTGHKVFGLILLPIDGNPFKYMGVIGHPNNIHDIKPAKYSNYILTTGGTDFTINGWKYNVNPMNDAVLNNGSDLKPFLTLLEGGEDGLKYQEMKNFFYYAQIKSKEENTTKHRTLSETVPNNLIHGLLAAMDYYPSQKEVLNITNEISKSDVKVDGVTFDMFVKIYLNHRPYKALEMNKMDNSHDVIKNFIIGTKHKDLEKYNDTKFTNDKGVGRDVFFKLLSEQGEAISETEMQDILRVLRGDSNMKSLPENLSFQYLFEELLKFEVSSDNNKENEND